MAAKKPPPGRPFEKGKSGNPGGRPSTKSFKAFLSEIAPQGPDAKGDPITWREALNKRLVRTALDSTHKDHMAALTLALAYDLGRPRDRVEWSGPEGGPIETADMTGALRTTGELRKRMAELEMKRAARRAKTQRLPTAEQPQEQAGEQSPEQQTQQGEQQEKDQGSGGPEPGNQA